MNGNNTAALKTLNAVEYTPTAIGTSGNVSTPLTTFATPGSPRALSCSM